LEFLIEIQINYEFLKKLIIIGNEKIQHLCHFSGIYIYIMKYEIKIYEKSPLTKLEFVCVFVLHYHFSDFAYIFNELKWNIL